MMTTALEEDEPSVAAQLPLLADDTRAGCEEFSRRRGDFAIASGRIGTHIGCEHGVCSACTVLVDDEPVRSCLMFAMQADGHSIRTVEGLQQDDRPHPIEAFVRHRALQCGFPSFLTLAVGVLEKRPDLDEEELVDLLSSNLCHWTGCVNIIKAVRGAAAAMKARL